MTLATTHPKSQTWLRTALAALVLFLLFAWLWQFRAAAFLRHEAAGRVVSRAPLVATEGAPVWLMPFYTAINYINTTWETTLVALLIAGTLQTFLHAPLLRLLKTQTGWRAYFAGIVFGIPNALCTCCAAPLFASLYKKGTPLGTALATFITAPSLNFVVLLLAFAFLPLPLAIARIGLGLVAVIAVPYLAAKMSGAPPPPPGVAEPDEENVEWKTLAIAWACNIWEMVRLAVPLLVIGYVLVGIIQVLVPLKTLAPMLDNGWLPLVLTALIGTIIMVPTFSEIVLVSTLMPLGLGAAPAVALLITAPAVSLPSLIVIGRATRSWRVPLVIGALIFLLGVAGGWIFLIAGG